MNLAHTTKLSDRAAITRMRVRAGLESGQVPVVSQIVQIIKDVSGKADKISVTDLADCISREPATMTRIISIAGSLGYNPNGLPVTSLVEAVAVVGFERVRNLAVQLLLLDNTHSARAGKLNQDLAALCLVSGLFAAELCRVGVPADRDLAFICGALRSYGRMLLATFLPEDYRAALDRGGLRDEAPAFRMVFGLSPLQLGQEMLALLQLPPQILHTLQRPTRDLLERAPEDPTAALIAVADLGLTLAEGLLASQLTHRNFDRRIAALTEGYPPVLRLAPETAKELVLEVAARLDGFGVRGSLSVHGVPLLRRLDCLAQGRPLPRLPAPPLPGRKDSASSPPPARPVSPPRRSATAKALARAPRVLQAGGVKIDQLLGAPKPAPKRVLKLIAQTIRQAMNLDACVVFLRDRPTGLFLFSCGTGSLLAAARSQVLDPNQRTIFAVPIRRGEDVLIENPQDPGISPFVPDWLKRAGQALPILLLPIRDERGPFALLCAVSTQLRAFATVPEITAELNRMRSRVANLGRLLKD